MSRPVALVIVITVVLLITIAFGSLAAPDRPVTILPEDCELPVDGERLLTLDGSLPSDVAVTWDVNQGGIGSVLPGREAVLVATSAPAVITVTASISPALPGQPSRVTRQCTVTTAED